MPETFEKNFYVEFTQPATTVSNTVLRSVSINPQPEDVRETQDIVKYVSSISLFFFSASRKIRQIFSQTRVQARN